MHEFPDTVDHPAMAGPVEWAGVESIVALGRPPSVNSLGARGNRHAQRSSKKQWQQVFTKLLMDATGGPRWAYAEAAAELRYEKKITRFDEDNFRSPIAKALGDALDGGAAWRPVGGRWLPDDSSEFFRLRAVDYRVVRRMQGASSSLFGERRLEAPSTRLELRFLLRCPNQFGDAKPTPEGPQRSMCALPVGHVGECLDMQGARDAWNPERPHDRPAEWRDVRP